jgi:hypothetical protein
MQQFLVQPTHLIERYIQNTIVFILFLLLQFWLEITLTKKLQSMQVAKMPSKREERKF